MKVKQRFISNSSSASFIVAINPNLDEWIVASVDYLEGELDDPVFEGYATDDEFLELTKGYGNPIDIDIMEKLWVDTSQPKEFMANSPLDLINYLHGIGISAWQNINWKNAQLAIEKGYIFRIGKIGNGGMASEGDEHLYRVGLKSDEELLVIHQPGD